MRYYWNGEEVEVVYSCNAPESLILRKRREPDGFARWLWHDGEWHEWNCSQPGHAYWPSKEEAIAFLSQQLVPQTPEYDEIDQMED